MGRRMRNWKKTMQYNGQVKDKQTCNGRQNPSHKTNDCAT